MDFGISVGMAVGGILVVVEIFVVGILVVVGIFVGMVVVGISADKIGEGVLLV